MSGVDRAERVARNLMLAYANAEATGIKWQGHSVCVGHLCSCKVKEGGHERIHARTSKCHPEVTE